MGKKYSGIPTWGTALYIQFVRVFVYGEQIECMYINPNERAFRCSSASGETKLECFICGVKNVLQLGMVVAESRGVVVIVCR